MPKRQVELFGAVTSAGVIVPRQLEGLRDVTKGFLHGLESNWPALSEESSANPGGKGKEEVGSVRLAH
jgi:hypothetical protein